jgi:transposase-like protein
VKLTLRNIADQIHDEHDAYLLLEELRWKGTPICPHCGHDKAYFLNPKGGSRGTGMKKPDGERTRSIRRVWKCAKCRKQFSVLTGTIFHGTKVSLRTWLMVMVQMSSAKNGISAREVERMHGVTPETAWFMLHRLREAMKRDPLAGLLSGTVVADETRIGGKPKNKHQQGKPRPYSPGGGGRHARGNPYEDKIPVMSLVSEETGEVRSVVVPDVTGTTLRKAMQDHVDVPNTTLHTDRSGPYRKIGSEFAGHRSVDHQDREYVRYDDGVIVTTNAAEGYFSQLKRSIDGTHHRVSTVHLPRYLAEFDYRYSTRKLTDSARMERMIDQAAGRRLTYRPLTNR